MVSACSARCVREEGRKGISLQGSSESQPGQWGTQRSDCPSEEPSRDGFPPAQPLIRSSLGKGASGLSTAAGLKMRESRSHCSWWRSGGQLQRVLLKGDGSCASVTATLYFGDTLLSLSASPTASVFLCSLIFLRPALKRWGSSGEALSSPGLLFPWTVSAVPVASLVTSWGLNSSFNPRIL